MTADELLGRLHSCIEAEAGGQSERVRERRRRLLDYWYASLMHRYRDPGKELDPAWYGEVAALFGAYAEACERFLDRNDAAGVEQALAWDVFEAVRETIRAVDRAIAGYDEAAGHGDRAAADGCIHRALGELFDWDNNRRIRAYVYVLTGEALTDGSAKTEKSRLLDVIEACRTRLAADIDRLLG
jgi:hypothetical protein